MNISEANFEEKQHRDQLTYEAWGGSLSIDDYYKRERALRSCEWTEKGQKTWLLKNDYSEILASCETFEMKSYRLFEGQVRIGCSLGIGSVFTEKKLRRRGFSTLLIQKLIDKIKYGSNQIDALILFSEIGEDFYHRLGFSTAPSFEWVVSVNSETTELNVYQLILPGEDQVVENLLLAPRGSSFVIWPCLSQLQWHFRREQIYGDVLDSTDKPLYLGARIEDSSIIWSIDYKSKALKILFFQTDSGRLAELLLKQAMSYSKSKSLKKVLLWSNQKYDSYLDQLALTDTICLEKRFRADSIAMIRSMNPDILEESWDQIHRAIWI